MTPRIFRFRLLIGFTAALLGFALMVLLAPPAGVSIAAPPAQSTCDNGTCDIGENGANCFEDCCFNDGSPEADPLCPVNSCGNGIWDLDPTTGSLGRECAS